MVLQLLARIAVAERVQDVFDLAVAHFATLGFARINYGLTRARSKSSIGDPDDLLFLSNNSREYINVYLQQGHYARTPIYRWLNANSGATTWAWVQRDLEAGLLPPHEVEAVRLNATFGIVAGIAFSFPEVGERIKGALGLVANTDLDHDAVEAIWARHHDEITAVAHMMHLKIAALPATNARRGLTNRQREALEWVADGKTMQDVALLMGVSTAMIEKHLRLAREALDVETTAQAVAKAAMFNQIFRGIPDGKDSLT